MGISSTSNQCVNKTSRFLGINIYVAFRETPTLFYKDGSSGQRFSVPHDDSVLLINHPLQIAVYKRFMKTDCPAECGCHDGWVDIGDGLHFDQLGLSSTPIVSVQPKRNPGWMGVNWCWSSWWDWDGGQIQTWYRWSYIDTYMCIITCWLNDIYVTIWK